MSQCEKEIDCLQCNSRGMCSSYANFKYEQGYNKAIDDVIELVKVTKDESKVVLDEDITVILEEVPTTFENDDWTPCSERLPSKEECGTYGCREFQVTIPQYDGNKTTVMDYEYTTVRGKEISRWRWNGRLSPWGVIAWKPLSEPYKE